jgi:hypothetical protein
VGTRSERHGWGAQRVGARSEQRRMRAGGRCSECRVGQASGCMGTVKACDGERWERRMKENTVWPS